MPFYIQLLHLALAAVLAGVTPIVMILVVIGLATAIFQSAFQIEDATFSLLPKAIAMIGIGLFGGFGALQGFEQFAVFFISHAPSWVHRSWS